MIKVERTTVKPYFYGLQDKGYSRFFKALIVEKDGSSRWMICRMGVTAHLKGGNLSYDPRSKGYLVVADMDLIRRKKQGEPVKSVYRTINLNTVAEYKIGGKHCIVID